MDALTLGKALIERRLSLGSYFESPDQKGLFVLFALFEASQKQTSSLGELLTLANTIEDRAVFYDVNLLRDEIGISGFRAEETRPLISYFLSVCIELAFGARSRPDRLHQVSEEISNVDQALTSSEIGQAFLSWAANAMFTANNGQRQTLIDEICKHCEEMHTFSENFLLYPKLESSIAALTDIDSRITSLAPVPQVESEHRQLFDLLRSIGVSLHNTGKVSRAVPDLICRLLEKYFPTIVEASPQHKDDAAFLRKRNLKELLFTIAILVFILVVGLPGALNNAYSWYVTEFGDNRGTLVVKRVHSQTSAIQSGDAILGAEGLLRPSLNELRGLIESSAGESIRMSVSKEERLVEVELPIELSDSGQKMLGLSFYNAPLTNKMWLVWFVVAVTYFGLLLVGNFSPKVGLVCQTLIPIFLLSTLAIFAPFLPRIAAGLTDGRFVWSLFMLLAFSLTAYQAYRSVPVLGKWKAHLTE